MCFSLYVEFLCGGFAFVLRMTVLPYAGEPDVIPSNGFERAASESKVLKAGQPH